MFGKKSFIDEIASSMERQLVDGAINKQAETQSRIVKAADYLNAAAEIFDETGMSVQSEVVTAVLESLAAKKSKKKKKTKSKNPFASKNPFVSKDSDSDEPTDDGKKKWNFDKSDAQDHNSVDDNCAMCGSDKSYAADKDSWWHLFRAEDPNITANFFGSADKAKQRKQVAEENWGTKYKLSGPFDSLLELEKKFNSHFTDKNDVSLADDEDELYSMLDRLKSDNSNKDFEDDFDVEVEDPFRDLNKFIVD